MATTSDLRPGIVIRFNNELCTVLESQHRTPGNLRAFYQVKMRQIKNGKLLENRFRSGEEIDIVRVERKTMQFLYRDAEDMVFMDTETYDQVHVPEVVVGEQAGYLKESGEATISFNGSDVVQVELPPHVTLLIAHTEPGVKGDTATGATKPATMESGATVMVPLFVNEGDMIRVDTRSGEYLDRVKN
ncbi:MAG TPA: elongation factor P [Candidatus Kapabacteria bacterium]|nr:elongation factor P [Candidatus Kapabacteria bacterium]